MGFWRAWTTGAKIWATPVHLPHLRALMTRRAVAAAPMPAEEATTATAETRGVTAVGPVAQPRAETGVGGHCTCLWRWRLYTHTN
jgi:hypothetical protein